VGQADEATLLVIDETAAYQEIGAKTDRRPNITINKCQGNSGELPSPWVGPYGKKTPLRRVPGRPLPAGETFTGLETYFFNVMPQGGPVQRVK